MVGGATKICQADGTWTQVMRRIAMRMTLINDVDVDNNAIEARQPIAVSDISVYICLIDIRSKSKEQLNERRAGLSTQAWPLINTLFISIH